MNRKDDCKEFKGSNMQTSLFIESCRIDITNIEKKG